jgi:hypothetical protein
MVLQGDVGQVKAYLGPFGDSINLNAIGVRLCVESTIGMEIILGAPDSNTR